jgi:hypothetical protein
MTVSIQNEAFAPADRQVKEAEQAAKIHSAVNRPWKATGKKMKKHKKEKERKKKIITTH